MAYGLETREELGLQRRYVFTKGNSAFEDDPKKSWNGIKVEGELNKRRWKWRLAWWDSLRKRRPHI